MLSPLPHRSVVTVAWAQPPLIAMLLELVSFVFQVLLLLYEVESVVQSL